MARENFSELLAFLAVAHERSFTRAAAQLGVSQSALSHTIRSFEAKLGVRLLTRTTRGVSPTSAGEQLFQAVSPRIEEVRAEIAAVGELRDKPAGTIRITATDYAIRGILWPKLVPFLQQYPDIKVECVADYALVDIVAERYDLGVRPGDSVAKDMIAVRIAPDLRMAIVGAPAYLERSPPPLVPHDLTAHDCINLRTPTHGGLYAWELRKDGQDVQVRVEGQLNFSGIYEILDAALAGFGLAYMPEDLARPHVEQGRLAWVLEDWFPTFTGYHIYFPSRRQSSRALRLLVDALRYNSTT
ncbi:LysR family transcriptional regulator [Paludibacterium sp. THUN1379]|uniref:LysR family transcriptional regulator n=1 Tax=Paludibacterium sp. THUN1379 TaxID=3112107 RepID=UPI00308C0581|nr:LysR family transcriptional regulator [Paludibacterium sp. THUN1379]